MFASKVETGLRLAMPDDRLRGQVEDGVDLVLAQGPLEQRLVADVAADDLDPVDQPRRTSSLCGTQSRTRQTTSAPASSSRRTSQPPTSPVAPVTRVGRSVQNSVELTRLSLVPGPGHGRNGPVRPETHLRRPEPRVRRKSRAG